MEWRIIFKLFFRGTSELIIPVCNKVISGALNKGPRGICLIETLSEHPFYLLLAIVTFDKAIIRVFGEKLIMCLSNKRVGKIGFINIMLVINFSNSSKGVALSSCSFFSDVANVRMLNCACLNW